MCLALLQSAQSRKKVIHSAPNRVIGGEALGELCELKAKVRRTMRRRVTSQQVHDLELQGGHLSTRLGVR